MKKTQLPIQSFLRKLRKTPLVSLPAAKADMSSIASSCCWCPHDGDLVKYRTTGGYLIFFCHYVIMSFCHYAL